MRMYVMSTSTSRIFKRVQQKDSLYGLCGIYIDRADLDSDNELNWHYELLITDNALCFKNAGDCVLLLYLNAAIWSMCQECAYEVQHRIDQAQYCRCHVRVVLIFVQLDKQAGGGCEQQQSRNRVVDQLLQGITREREMLGLPKWIIIISKLNSRRSSWRWCRPCSARWDTRVVNKMSLS